MTHDTRHTHHLYVTVLVTAALVLVPLGRQPGAPEEGATTLDTNQHQVAAYLITLVGMQASLQSSCVSHGLPKA